jgi:hypothetical protein
LVEEVRSLFTSIDRIGPSITLLCGVATLIAGAVTLVTKAPAALSGNPLAWVIGFPELAAGLVCAFWSRQQLQW